MLGEALVLAVAMAGPPVEGGEADVGRSLTEVVEVPSDDVCLGAGLDEPIAAWLGRERVEGDLRVRVHASEGAVGFVLLRAGEVRVERELSPAPSECADRRAALGLAIAMALDAAVLEALAPPAEPEPEPVPVPSPVPAELPPSPEVEPEPPVDRTRALRLAGTLEATTVLGALPRLGSGGELGLELGWWSWLDLRMAGGGAAGLRASLGDGEVDSALGWGSLSLCPARGLARVRVRLCAGVGAGAMWARGRGFDRSQSVTLPWVAVRTGADLDVRVASRVALRVGGTLLTPVVRGQVSVRDSADQLVDRREPAPAGAQLGVGVVVRLAGPGG